MRLTASALLPSSCRCGTSVAGRTDPEDGTHFAAPSPAKPYRGRISNERHLAMEREVLPALDSVPKMRESRSPDFGALSFALVFVGCVVANGLIPDSRVMSSFDRSLVFFWIFVISYGGG